MRFSTVLSMISSPSEFRRERSTHAGAPAAREERDTKQRRFLTSRRARWFFGAALSTIVSLLCVRAVEAKVKNHLHAGADELGRRVFMLIEHLGGDAQTPQSHNFEINGIEILAHTKVVTASPAQLDQVLGAFEQRCETPIAPGVGDVEPALVPTPMLKSRGKTESYIYCIRPKRHLSAAGIETMAREFSDSRDLSAIGQMGGLYVRSSGQRHQILMIEMPGRFLVDRAFPKQGDVSGLDSAELPRPEGRRTLSVAFEGRPVQNAYSVEGDRRSVLDQYAQKLREEKLSLLTPPAPDGRGAFSLVARTQRDTFLVIAHAGDRFSRYQDETSIFNGEPQKGSARGHTTLSITRLIQ